MVPPFVNWAGNVRSQPTAWAAPADEAEARALVRAIRARRGRLRVHGARHSWSPIAASDDVQVSLERMNRVVSVQQSARTVTVQGGCRLATLNRALAARGLALPILGSIAEQTLSGAIATGTHGSSLRHGNLSTFVERLRLVDGRGEVVELAGDDPRLAGARVHLGALGVVTEVTLRVVPAFGLVETLVRLPIEEAAARLAQLSLDHEYLKVWWYPPSEEVGLFTLARGPADSRRAFAGIAWEAAANAVLFPSILAATRRDPSLIVPLNRAIDRVHLRPAVRTGRSDEIFLLAVPPRHRETELAFPAHRAGEALLALRDLVRDTGARLDFLSELRFVRGDDGWMSPAHGRDTCQLGVYATHSPDATRAFADFATLGRRWDARPHWGKEGSFTHEAISRTYPRAEVFRALARAFDPDGVFRNGFLDAVLGPVDLAGRGTEAT